MKTFAIAALIGLLSVEQVEAQMAEYVFRPVEFIQQSESQCTDSSDSSCDDDDDTDVQVAAEDYPANMSGFGGYHTYMRDTPDRFETEADDTLMKSMYATYATEGEKDHLPTGRFWVTKENAMKACDEVVNTHLHLNKDERKSYLDAQFPSLWTRFDVNEEGKIEIDRMPQLLRSICGSAEACLGL